MRDSGWLFQDALSGDVVPYVHYGSCGCPCICSRRCGSAPHGDRQIGSPSDRSIAYALRAFAHLRRLREDSEEDGEISGAGDSGGGMLEEVFWDDLEEESMSLLCSLSLTAVALREHPFGGPEACSACTAVPEEVDIEVFLYVSAHAWAVAALVTYRNGAIGLVCQETQVRDRQGPTSGSHYRQTSRTNEGRCQDGWHSVEEWVS